MGLHVILLKFNTHFVDLTHCKTYFQISTMDPRHNLQAPIASQSQVHVNQYYLFILPHRKKIQ